jgi:hypothetical protein
VVTVDPVLVEHVEGLFLVSPPGAVETAGFQVVGGAGHTAV